MILVLTSKINRNNIDRQSMHTFLCHQDIMKLTIMEPNNLYLTYTYTFQPIFNNV